MKRTQWIVNFRNTLSSLGMECDSCAAIMETQMSSSEREQIKKSLQKVINYIDKNIKIKS